MTGAARANWGMIPSFSSTLPFQVWLLGRATTSPAAPPSRPPPNASRPECGTRQGVCRLAPAARPFVWGPHGAAKLRRPGVLGPRDGWDFGGRRVRGPWDRAPLPAQPREVRQRAGGRESLARSLHLSPWMASGARTDSTPSLPECHVISGMRSGLDGRGAAPHFRYPEGS